MDIEKNDSVKKYSIDIDEIDLKALFGVLWKAKVLITIITSIFSIFSVFYALSLPNVYKSEAILTVDNSSNNSGISLGGLSGLASFAGIEVSSAGDKKQLALETLQSRAFLKRLITFDGVLPSIMAVDSYDAESKKIIFNSDIYDDNEKKWIESSESSQSKPTYLQAYDAYLSLISIKDDIFITISVEHMSPIFAKELLDLIIRETNELLRSKDLLESSDAINFLSTEMSKSSLITMKDAMNELVHSRLEMQMMAKISNEYILKIIEPPFIPEKKSGPVRAIICITISLAGGLFAIFIVLIRHFKFRSYSQ